MCVCVCVCVCLIVRHLAHLLVVFLINFGWMGEGKWPLLLILRSLTAEKNRMWEAKVYMFWSLFFVCFLSLFSLNEERCNTFICC